MTAPALPEVFGNYALKPFVEIVPPEAVSWLPQTAGWIWLTLAATVLVLHFVWRGARKWHRNRYRKEAIQQLRALDPQSNSDQLVSAINRVLKLAALVAYSRTNVAQLAGGDWVEFLNRQCEQPPFATEQAYMLAVSTYRGDAIEPESARQILEASVRWLQLHRGPDHA